MDAASLTPEQQYALLLALADRRDWLGKLRGRMDAAGWAADDPFYGSVVAAREAVPAALVVLAEAAPEPPPPELAGKRWQDKVADTLRGPPGAAGPPGAGGLDPPGHGPESSSRAAEPGASDTAGLPWVGKSRRTRRRR